MINYIYALANKKAKDKFFEKYLRPSVIQDVKDQTNYITNLKMT